MYYSGWQTFSVKGPESRDKNQVYYIGAYVTRKKHYWQNIKYNNN